MQSMPKFKKRNRLLAIRIGFRREFLPEVIMAADWPPENFLADVDAAARGAKRKILQRHYVPQPPDFPISRAEPAYLKTVWLRIG
jgi:hypothetical protein